MEKRGGKNRALNALSEKARGELLFFTDANSHIEPGCVRQMVRHFADARVGCVTGNSCSSDNGINPAQETGAMVYWGHELLIKRLENQFGSVLVCDGAIFCIRRSLYVPLLPELANDLELPLRIGHAGYLIRYEPQARVLEKDTNSPVEEFRRRRRICGQGALGMWRLRQTLYGRRGWQFLSQKLLRWLTLVPMVLILASSSTLARRPAFGVILGVQVFCYLAALAGLRQALGGKRPGRILSVPLYVAISAVGAFTGVIDALVGGRYDIWESPSLSRGRDEVVVAAGAKCG
jgi:cellulose synthase/poly-beta-1,6-N-acetylglucosamine synthase-like glycosyltransferase